MLNEKLSAADELRRTPQKNLSLPTNDLRTASGIHSHWGFRAASRNRGHRRSAGPGSRRLRLAYAPLEKAHRYLILITIHYNLNVNPLLEAWMPANFRCQHLPILREIFHKNHIVGVAHGNRNASHFARCELN